jgi:hypothetical protein
LPEALIDLVGKGLVQVILLGQDITEITRIDVTEGVLTLSGRAGTAQVSG